jgi:hypothetical protein
MTPGADWEYAITAGVRGGKLLPAIAGLAGDYVVQVTLVVVASARCSPRASGLNPKGMLLLFAVRPQFVARTAPWPVTLQLAVLGAVHIVAWGLVYLSSPVTRRPWRRGFAITERRTCGSSPTRARPSQP